MTRRRLTIAIAAVLILAGALWWWFSTSTSQQLPMVRFIGLTNCVVGPNVAAFSGTSTNYASLIQRWFMAGSNAAVFTITNRETCIIQVFACSLQTRGKHPTDEQTLALDSPVTYGFYLLQPGQSVTSHIAVIPHSEPWRVAFFYNRHDWREKLRALSAAVLHRPPIQLQSHVFHSDWIDQ
jgi:hypothetical protein